VALLDGDAPPAAVARFYSEIEKKFGIKCRTAKRLVRRGRNISPGLWQAIRDSKKAVPDGVLDRLAGLENEQRREVERLVIEDGLGIAAAVKAVGKSDTRAPLTVEMAVARIRTGWLAWGQRDRKKFIASIKKISS
jgi:hypothetical protein